MDDQGGAKISGIRQIVRLKELLHKWQSVTLSPRASDILDPQHHHPPNPHHHRRSSSASSRPIHGQHVGVGVAVGGISPGVTRRLRSVISDSDEEGCQTPEPPPDVPKGYLAVYVGEERRRFVIPTTYLGHDLFKKLLDKVEEEYGFDHSGALSIPCEIETFKYLIKCIETHPKGDHGVAEDASEIPS